MSGEEHRARKRRNSAAFRLRQRRKRAKQMRAEGATYREIADRLRCSLSTVHAYLSAPEPEPAGHPNSLANLERARPISGAQAGNTRSLTHGVNSERRLAPVRKQHARGLAERYPWIDPGRRAVQAQRLAMADLAGSWLDEQGTVVRDDEAGCSTWRRNWAAG